MVKEKKNPIEFRLLLENMLKVSIHAFTFSVGGGGEEEEAMQDVYLTYMI